jgi:hypothetical protein
MYRSTQSCNSILDNLPIVMIGAPFNLYHMTQRNTPRTRAELESLLEDEGAEGPQHIISLPEGAFPTDLTQQKWFSISYYAPLYIGANKPDRVALQYRINAPMVLFDGRRYPRRFGLNEPVFTQNEAGEWIPELFQDVLGCLQTDPRVRQCIDGWLLQEELDEPWYELLLFRPSEIVDPRYTISSVYP